MLLQVGASRWSTLTLLVFLLLLPLLLGESNQDTHYIWVFCRILRLERLQPFITNFGPRPVEWFTGRVGNVLLSKRLYLVK